MCFSFIISEILHYWNLVEGGTFTTLIRNLNFRSFCHPANCTALHRSLLGIKGPDVCVHKNSWRVLDPWKPLLLNWWLHICCKGSLLHFQPDPGQNHRNGDRIWILCLVLIFVYPLKEYLYTTWKKNLHWNQHKCCCEQWVGWVPTLVVFGYVSGKDWARGDRTRQMGKWDLEKKPSCITFDSSCNKTVFMSLLVARRCV